MRALAKSTCGAYRPLSTMDWGGRMKLLIAVLVLLAFPAAALARKAHANTPRTLVVSGSTSKASDWLPEGKPQLGDTLTIPAGKTGVVKTELHAGNITVEGELTGPASIESSGTVTFDHPVGWHEMLINTGLDLLNAGGTELATVESAAGSIISLQAPLSVRGDLEWQKSTFDTNGYAVHVGGDLYPLQEAYSAFGSSTLTAGEFLDYPPSTHHTFQFSEAATVRVTWCNTTFKGAQWYYAAVELAGCESTFSGDSYDTDLLGLDSPVVTVEDGQTITTDLITSNATEAHPVRVQAGTILGGPGGEATIDCDGCALPPYVELVGVTLG